MICFVFNQSISMWTNKFEYEHDIVSSIDIFSLIIVKIQLFLLFHVCLLHELLDVDRLTNLSTILPSNIKEIFFLLKHNNFCCFLSLSWILLFHKWIELNSLLKEDADKLKSIWFLILDSQSNTYQWSLYIHLIFL